MSAFFYIVTEGVHDVAFIGKLLALVHGAKRLKKLEDLEEFPRQWLENSFNWPMKRGDHHDIERLAVPAPVFYALRDRFVAIRNAQGITEIGKTLTIDFEVFDRAAVQPDAVGVVLDSDEKPAEERFADSGVHLATVGLAAPLALGEVTAGTPRVGVFALPEPGTAGTLEDILLALGDAAYPELTAAARGYADRWRGRADAEPAADDWRDLRRPAGMKKATIGAMTAILKPGKSAQVSIEDNRWVGEDTKALACLGPCLAFLSALLGLTGETAEPDSRVDT